MASAGGIRGLPGSNGRVTSSASSKPPRSCSQAWTADRCNTTGSFHQQPLRPPRPAPLRTFRGRTYAAAVSPESSRDHGRTRRGLLIIPQKPWETTKADLAAYRDIYQEVNGTPAPPPIVASWAFCDHDSERARELALRYVGGYYDSVLTHYELAAGHLAGVAGYEYYAQMAEHVNAERQAAIGFFADLQVWGTPAECIERAMNIRSALGNDSFIVVPSFGGMPYDEAERNLRLLAAEVLPELKRQ